MDNVNEKLNEMYDKGRTLKWTIPSEAKPDTSIEFLMQQQAANLKEWQTSGDDMRSSSTVYRQQKNGKTEKD